MKKGFTLIELVVAIAILGMVVSFAGVVFKVSIESYRMATAHTEIMQKLRAITDQLNADFKGIRTDAPLLLRFFRDSNAPNDRYDQIMFFADGDFQSTLLYDDPSGSGVKTPSDTGDLVRGNVARIYCGQARVSSRTAPRFLLPWQQDQEDASDPMLNRRNRILARRQHILSADSGLPSFPSVTMVGGFSPLANCSFEHDSNSLADWKVITADAANNDNLISMCFDNLSRSPINLQDMTGLHMLMSQHVSSFSVQWAYIWAGGVQPELRWWPSVDPDGDPRTSDSDFDAMAADQFGIYFNMPGGLNLVLDWFGPESAESFGWNFPPGFFPEALKFTFTLYDSKGVIKDGRTFTHIVYLGN